MSDAVNESWFERARLVSEYFESELPARLVRSDLERGDMEALVKHVTEAEAEMEMQTPESIAGHDIVLVGHKLFNAAIEDATDVF